MKATSSIATVAAALLALAAASSPAAAVGDASAAEEGKSVYENYCATCHGEQLHNTSGGLTFDLRRLKPDEHERFAHSVLNGKNQMPPWKGVLDDSQIDAIWAYIRATVDQ